MEFLGKALPNCQKHGMIKESKPEEEEGGGIQPMGVKESVAALLQEASGRYISGQTLAKKLQVSRNAVWKAIQALQEEGVPITSRQKSGYRMDAEADLLTKSQIKAFLRGVSLGNPLYVLPETDSTNSYCRRLLRENAPHGTLVVANCQTAGRGRQGRSFCSPAGSGLYFSVIISQKLSLQEAPLLTACTAVAACRAIDRLCGTQMQIKWVNDLFLNGKKCCGILTEGEVSLESGCLEHAVIGIGINIRNTASSLPEELHDKVTSLEESVPGCHICRAELTAAIVTELEQALEGLSDRRFLPEYRSRSYLTGKTAELLLDDGTRKKVAVVEIADDCGLVVRDSFGNVETLHSGEVHVTQIE